MANAITCIRIICAFALMFCPVLTVPFYGLYAIAGFSDMIDGFIARKTGTDSEFGSKLDTVADFVFVAVCAIKLIPILDLEPWVYIWIGIIAMIKGINIVSGIIVRKSFVSVHSVMNKITGALLFVLPFTVRMIDIKYSAAAVCALATLAAIQEYHYSR